MALAFIPSTTATYNFPTRVSTDQVLRALPTRERERERDRSEKRGGGYSDKVDEHRGMKASARANIVFSNVPTITRTHPRALPSHPFLFLSFSHSVCVFHPVSFAPETLYLLFFSLRGAVAAASLPPSCCLLVIPRGQVFTLLCRPNVFHSSWSLRLLLFVQ